MKKPNKNNGTSNKETLAITSFSVERATAFDNGGVVFDMTLNGIKIYGMRVVEEEGKDFIAFPSRKGKDDKYYSIVWARLSDKDAGAILQEVENKLNA